MTTGRINQVTILRVRSHTLEGRSRLVTPHPRRDDQDIYKVGDRAEAPCPARATPGAEAAERSPRAIQLPPLSFPRSGPGQTWGFATLNAGPHCPIRPSEGGYQPPITWGPPPCSEAASGMPTGYRLRLTPKCLRIMIAIGQPSTDSFRAPGASPWVFRPPSSGQRS